METMESELRSPSVYLREIRVIRGSPSFKPPYRSRRSPLFRDILCVPWFSSLTADYAEGRG